MTRQGVHIVQYIRSLYDPKLFGGTQSVIQLWTLATAQSQWHWQTG